MSAVTTIFLGIGCLSLLVLTLSLVGGHLHLGHLHVGHLHLGHLHVGHGGHGGVNLTLPALAGFLGAFGFGGAIASELSGHSALIAAAVGLAAAVPTAWAAGRLVDAAENMSTDATPTSADLIGATGVVISPVPGTDLGPGAASATALDRGAASDAPSQSRPAPSQTGHGGFGEVRLTVAGQPMKFYARAAQPLAIGTRVFVIEVPSPTSVLVEPTPEIL
jgi:hypothetical protein